MANRTNNQRMIMEDLNWCMFVEDLDRRECCRIVEDHGDCNDLMVTLGKLYRVYI